MNTQKKISDFKLERYLVGDLSAEEMQEIRRRKETDGILRTRLQVMSEDGKRILAENPFSQLEPRLDEMDSAGGRLVSFPRSVMKVAAAIVVALGIFSTVLMMSNDRDLGVGNVESRGTEVALMELGNDTRIKGMDVRMEVWKKSGDTAIQMENMGEAREGDELQLRYSVPQKCYGLLFSMDGNGVLTVHLGNGAGSVALEPGQMVTLPFAYKLDNAPYFEKFYLMTSEKTFAVDGSDIDASLKQEGVKVVELTIKKLGN